MSGKHSVQLDHKPLATHPLSGQLPLAAHVEIQTHFWEHRLGVTDGTAQSMFKRALVCYIYCDLKHTDKLSLEKEIWDTPGSSSSWGFSLSRTSAVTERNQHLGRDLLLPP